MKNKNCPTLNLLGMKYKVLCYYVIQNYKRDQLIELYNCGDYLAS